MMRPTGGPRVERGVGVLEHHLDAAAVARRAACDRSVERDVADIDGAPIRFDQAEHAAPDGGLAGAGLADEAQGLAAPDREARPFGGLDLAARSEEGRAREPLGQALDDEGRRRRRIVLGGGGSRDGTAARSRRV